MYSQSAEDSQRAKMVHFRRAPDSIIPRSDRSSTSGCQSPTLLDEQPELQPNVVENAPENPCESVTAIETKPQFAGESPTAAPINMDSTDDEATPTTTTSLVSQSRALDVPCEPQIADQRDPDKMTVKELRELLEQNGLTTKGLKKVELVAAHRAKFASISANSGRIDEMEAPTESDLAAAPQLPTQPPPDNSTQRSRSLTPVVCEDEN